MSAVPQYRPEPPRPGRRPVAGRSRRSRRARPLPRVERFPAHRQRRADGKRKVPALVQLLERLQQAATLTAAGLAMTALGLSALTLHGQREWNGERQALEALRYQERNLSVATEALKSQLAEQAGSEAGLVDADPARMLFVTPADPGSSSAPAGPHAAPTASSESTPSPSERRSAPPALTAFPLGY